MLSAISFKPVAPYGNKCRYAEWLCSDMATTHPKTRGYVLFRQFFPVPEVHHANCRVWRMVGESACSESYRAVLSRHGLAVPSKAYGEGWARDLVLHSFTRRRVRHLFPPSRFKRCICRGMCDASWLTPAYLRLGLTRKTETQVSAL